MKKPLQPIIAARGFKKGDKSLLMEIHTIHT
jgi:hypothetical protein